MDWTQFGITYFLRQLIFPWNDKQTNWKSIKRGFARTSLSALVSIACERRRISGCHLVLPKNNVCEPESGNDFCDVMTFVSPWPIRFHDRMKLERSSQRIPRAVVLGLFELNYDWLRIPTSQKSFSGSCSQTLFFGRTKWQPEIRLRSQASVSTAFLILSNFQSCFYLTIRLWAQDFYQVRVAEGAARINYN